MTTPAATVEVMDSVAFSMDGVRYRIWKSEDLKALQGECFRTIDDLKEYVRPRVARSNGQRVSGMDLTIEFMPDGFEGHDTSIGSNLSVGRSVFISPQTVIGQGVGLGNKVKLGFWCTLGDHVTVESDVEIGSSNTLPDLATVRKGTIIPDDTFPPGLLPKGVDITQAYVDKCIADRSQSSVSRVLTALTF
ncbi:MAG TPA: hypothetical protein PKB15_02075 [Acidimicrobiia bacterium]|nr:hypothetical protein [Acidimicrobiia bacterium]